MMVSTTSQSRKFRTACDRCYKLKERCQRASTASSCVRCDRVGEVCSTVRPVRPMGRRPRRREQSPLSEITSSSRSDTHDAQTPNYQVSLWLQNNPDLDSEEKGLLTFLLSQPRTLRHFVVSSRFEDAEQQSFATLLPSALPVLKNAYLAYAGLVKSLHSGNITAAGEDVNVRHASSAMKTLRTLPVVEPEDAALCLTLGTALASFAYAAIGVGVSDICHYCLSVTRRFIETAALHPATEPPIVFLVLLETMHCMVYRQKPTLRLLSRTPKTIDPHLGLCLPLLPSFYDLCAISHSLANTTDTSLVLPFHHRLDRIKASVEAWQPSTPDNFIQQFKSAEIIHLLAQARVYRLAALLMIHRLRHVFGQADAAADVWSREIMMELELARRLTGGSPVRFVTLPFAVAAIEIRDPTTRIKVIESDVTQYVDQFTPVVQHATKTFLTRVWHERDCQITHSWFDSIHKPCVIVEATEVSFLGWPS